MMTNEEARKYCPVPFENFISLVLKRNYEAIQPLLKSKDFDVNMEDFRGVTVLHYAAELDDFELIKMILSQQPRAKINAKTLEMMSTPLMIAAGNGKTKALEILLENGADTSCQNASGYTALMLAVEGEHEDCVDILLERGNCNIKIQNFYGVNALMLSVNNFQIAKKLIKDSDLAQVDLEGSTVLHLVCKKGNFEVLKLLLEDPEIAVNYKNFKGETPLHLAIQNQHLEFARALIQNGASLLVKDANGMTVFHYAAIYDETEEFLQSFPCEDSEIAGTLILAAENGRLNTLKVLINQAESEFIGHALVSAAKGGHLECIKVLIGIRDYEPSADVLVDAGIAALYENKFDCFQYIYNFIMNGPEAVKEECLKHKDQIVSTAFSSGCFEACKLFLEEGVNPNGPDPETFLMAASGNGHIEVVELLLQHGAEVNRKHESMGSALLLSVINNHLEIVKLLLAKKANPSISDESGFTPLLCAAYYGYTEVFFEIFQVIGDTQGRTNDGLTALLAACISGDSEIVECLIENEVKMDEVDDSGNNCLHCAAENAKDVNVLIYLIQKIDNLRDLLTAPNKNGKTPLDLLISHQNQALIFSVLAAKNDLSDLIEFPCNFTIDSIDHHDMCLICRDDFVIGDSGTKLPCRHLFHESCYSEWSVTKANCPYCQRFPFKVKK